jgi:hypothetical protein
MRDLILATVAAIGFAGPVLAQGYPPPGQPAPVPPGANPYTGARPGNVIGTNSSLPLGNRASNINSGDTHSEIAPRLPSPPIGQNASVQAYLMAARDALAQGRTGEGQQSIEMAETRLLDRSVAPSEVNDPIQGPIIADLNQALQALSQHDAQGAIQNVNDALSRGGPALAQE